MSLCKQLVRLFTSFQDHFISPPISTNGFRLSEPVFIEP
jgi:hypothetical protein